MKDIPVRFNLSNSEERLDMFRVLLEVMAEEGELERVHEIINDYLASSNISEALESEK